MYLLRGISPRSLSIVSLRTSGMEMPIITVLSSVKIINPDNNLLAAEYLKGRKSVYDKLLL